MRPVLTHLLVAVVAAAAVILWPRPATHHENVTATSGQSKSERRHNTPDLASTRSASHRTSPGQRPERDFMSELSRKISRADLDSWILGKKGNPKAYAEALVTTGLLTNDLDLIRKGIEADPNNAHLLFVGASLGELPMEERQALVERLLAADPDNALPGFLSTALLLEAGQQEEAIDALKRATTPPLGQANDYGLATQLLMDDAYVAAGFSPEVAKIQSAYMQRMPYLTDLTSLANSLKPISDSMLPESRAEVNTAAALMGQHITNASRSGSAMNHLTGLTMEESILRGLPDDAPSPYEGMTIGEARQSIVEERQQIRDAIGSLPDVATLIVSDPDLMSRYIDRVRMLGEVQAAEWLSNEVKSQQ